MEIFNTIITEEAKKKVMECLDSGFLSEGELVRKFEARIHAEFGYPNPLAVNSGTSALQIVLYLILEPGDEVIIPAQTFVATGLTVLQAGGKVVFADIDVSTGNILVNDVMRKITPKTRAVIAVAWAGNPPELDKLEEICQKHNIILIQDNAQALGATYKGVPSALWGDFSCYSFQATKHLTTGDGGLVSCKDKISYEILKNLRWFGIDREKDNYDITGERQYLLYDVGFKFHMNNYAAALGIGNLVNIHQRINTRRQIARYYDQNIRDEFYIRRGDGSSCWVYDLLVENRDDCLTALREWGVPASVVHRGIHKHPVFGCRTELPNQETWDEKHISLPCHSSMTTKDVQRVVDAVNRGW